ncbi:hypothetical protein ACG04Q_24760 [Roseateles sp. DXS20W]|uniref:Uncharacterized protein n=1 Tax=Pelomonas lactea TaxID=3299030 RepID=A0ABW7GSK3_9BURK
MSNDCGCGGKKAAAGGGDMPTHEPPANQQTSEGSTMSDQAPTLLPPQASSSGSDAAASTGAPTLTPETANASDGGLTAWNNGKRVSALWAMNQNRNSWVYVTGVGWKKLANNSDSAIVALTLLGAHAKQTQTNYNYRDEADGMIHETYVW